MKRGVPLHLCAKVLGHANTNMLQRVYGQLDTEDVGRLINDRVAPSRHAVSGLGAR